ncbi:hypothetical protein M514_00200 [Trichuris suis]|uniref:Uncharacterized protein n=1 Tax=Trichuris suis TaxID=68888 RepID=A0A085NUC6_9BILA|nr:hypothetical protein M513_00200 [Trichuris suis]KFD73072.1 hypothetical protein M514_00200 [Trichuris suis]
MQERGQKANRILSVIDFKALHQQLNAISPHDQATSDQKNREKTVQLCRINENTVHNFPAA